MVGGELGKHEVSHQPATPRVAVGGQDVVGVKSTLGPRPNEAASAARLNTSGGWQMVEALDTGVYAVPNSYPPRWASGFSDSPARASAR